MDYFKNKKILITGIGGFVGGHLAVALLKRNARVFGLSLSGLSDKSYLAIEGYGKNLHRSFALSVADVVPIKRIFQTHRFDIVFHLAAQSLVEVGKADPTVTFETNVKGTWNILEVSRITNVRKVIVASTVHVYGDNPHVPFREEYFPQPSRPYETSKACADLIAQSYADSFGMDIEIPRFGNLYGPGDINYDRVIPKIIRQLVSGEQPKIWDVGAVRDFLFVEDAVRGYLMLSSKSLSRIRRGRVVNFGSGKPRTVVSVARLLTELARSKPLIVLKRPPKERKNEIKKQYLSIETAQKLLDWSPEISLQSGLIKTFSWYTNHRDTL